MKTVHTTKEGNSMLVAQMENSHLLYTIRYMLRKALGVIPTEPVDKDKAYVNALYGKKNLTPEEVAYEIERVIEFLAPYTIEVLFRIRDIQANEKENEILTEILDMLKVILGRETKLEGFPVLHNPIMGFLLNPDNEDDIDFLED